MIGAGVSPVSIAVMQSGALSTYAAAGFKPDLVFDFEQVYYRTSGTQTTFDSAITHSRSGNATMVDSDGLLKWAPHNLVLNSATPATQNITVVSGADYTVECTGVSIALSGAGTGTVTEGNPVEITASTTTLTLTVTGSTGTMWAYRSDLGGMVNNPDRGDSYVSTTSAARYLARRGHHVYNGTSWVNEGALFESEQRVNAQENSNVFTAAGNATITADQAVSPDGTTNASLYDENEANNQNAGLFGIATVTAGVTYTNSVFVKYKSGSGWVALCHRGSSNSNQFFAWFDIQSGVVGSNQDGVGTMSYNNHGMEDCGNGWYRIYTVGTDSVSTTYNTFVISASSDNDSGRETNAEFYIYGAQLEAGPTPSSYIPTSGSTVTRAADDADSDNLTYDSSAMWFTLSGLQTFADEGAAGQEVLFDWRADANNRITVTIDTDGAETGEITLTVVSGGTTWSVAQDYLSPGVNVPFSIAWRVTDTEINVAAGGTSATAVATTSIPDLYSASAAFDGNGVYSLFRQGIGDIGDSGIAEVSA